MTARFLKNIFSPVFSFVAGFYLTDLVFRLKKIPYPFEAFGIASGLGLACWMVAVIKFIEVKLSKKSY